MVFYVRPRGGVTTRLRKVAENQTTNVVVSIDGPYSTLGVASKLATHDEAILIAGGSGAGFLLPLIESLVQSSTAMHVVLIIRHLESVSWFIDAVEQILSSKQDILKVKVDIHVTLSDVVGRPGAKDNASSNEGNARDLEKMGTKTKTLDTSTNKSISVIEGKGRPDLPALIREWTMNAYQGMTVGVAACGPDSMMLDVRNACAEAQVRILSGKGGGVAKVWLHTEAFSW
jgi:ferric-chelate reductase